MEEIRLKDALAASPTVTALADESTDISNHKRLVIYAQVINDKMEPSTLFVSNVECKDTTGKGIGNTILEDFSARGVSPSKIMSLGSDGAAVMTGKTNGAAAIIKRQNPHCINIHCVAHKLALCTSQAAESIPSLKDHQQCLTDLFYYFSGSSKRASRFREIEEILQDPLLTIKELHSVRWLSYFTALTAVYRTIDSLLTYLAEFGSAGGKDYKAIGLKKKIATDKFIATTFLMMDAMAPVTILSQFFQTENVDIALVKVKLDLCLADLEKVKNLETPYLTELRQHQHDPGKFKTHLISKTNFNLQNVADKFVKELSANIADRFPSDNILHCFSILSMRPISFLSPEELEEYGQKEMSILCDHYGKTQTMHWKEDGMAHTNSTPPLIDSHDTLQEWQLIKKVVLAEQYTRDSTWKLWSLVSQFHPEFTNMIRLAGYALTLAVHTAGCERGFSVQNQVLTSARNRLNVRTQDQLMRVKLGPSRQTFNFKGALDSWKQKKNRRLYELKKLN